MISLQPRATIALPYLHLRKQEVLAVAWEVFRRLGWDLLILNQHKIVVHTSLFEDGYNEEVTVQLWEKDFTVTSKSLQTRFNDNGKNKNNLQKFQQSFEQIVRDDDIAALTATFLEDAKFFIHAEEKAIVQKSLQEKAKDFFTGLWKALTPSSHYVVTPVLIVLNLLVYFFVAFKSGSFLEIDGETLIRWGGNTKAHTLDGQPWRLFTSGFLHGGILHLFFNLYVLQFIGKILELPMGKLKFATAYVLSLLFSGLTSVWWNDYGVSVGASGALFGLFGVFLALNSTEIVSREDHEQYFISIIIFIAINLLLGLQEGIDNAAHIGGLISGLVIGISLYPSLRYPHKKKLLIVNLLLLTLVSGVLILWALLSIPNWGIKYEKAIQQFVENEEIAMNYYKLSDFASREERLRELNEVGIPKWQANIALMEEILQIDQLPTSLRLRASRLHKYSQLRLRSFEILQQGMLNEGKDYSSELKEVHASIRDVLIEINPDEPSRYIERAKDYKEKGNLKAALKDYDMAIALNPSNPYIRVQRARIYYQIGDFISAIVDYNHALEVLPNDVDLLIEVASCKESAGLYREALQHYNRAIQLSPNASPAYNGRAWVYHQLGNLQLALNDFQKALQLNPSYGYAYNNLGLLEEERGNEKEALQYFKKAVEVDEGADYAYRNVARMFANKKNYQKAFQAYSMAIRSDYLDADNYFGRARMAFLLHAYDSMLADLNEAIQRQPNRAVLYEFRAIAKEKKNAPPADIHADLTLAATLDTLHQVPTASHYTYQAGLFLETQLYPQAERDYRKAISLDSTYSTAFGNFGWLKYLQQQYDSCIIYSQRAIQLDEKAFYAKYNLALAKLCLGKTEEAIKDYFTFKNQELAFRGYVSQGAIEDLRDLIKKKEKVNEAHFVLKEIFHAKQ